MKLIGNQECFAIVGEDNKTYIAIGQTIIAEATSEEHAREMIETKDWRLIVGVASLIAHGAVEDYKQFKEEQNNEARDKKNAD